MNVTDCILQIAEQLQLKKHRLSLAESCTGGGIAYAITEISGCSAWFDRAFIPYSNLAKQEMLGVPLAILDSEGAVSEASARAMAEGALTHSAAQISLAVTGIAGPSGGSRSKPVGTIWLAWSSIAGSTMSSHYHLLGDRHSIRQQTIELALSGLYDFLSCAKPSE